MLQKEGKARGGETDELQMLALKYVDGQMLVLACVLTHAVLRGNHKGVLWSLSSACAAVFMPSYCHLRNAWFPTALINACGICADGRLWHDRQ